MLHCWVHLIDQLSIRSADGPQDGAKGLHFHTRKLSILTGAKTLNAKNASALDQDLTTVGGFSFDQLMELAGLSVSQAGIIGNAPLEMEVYE